MSEPGPGPHAIYPFQTDHLLLLVGSNPLPNYVAAKLLLKKGGQAYLIHTAASADVARSLTQELGPAVRCHLYQTDPADRDAIRATVAQAIKGTTPDTVGLNYTGGTKAMSVHAYMAVQETIAGQQPVLSYLDARLMKMRFDPIGGTAHLPVDVRTALSSMQVRDLTRLHGWDISSTPVPVLPETVGSLAVAHSKIATAREWKDWCRRFADTYAQRDLNGRILMRDHKIVFLDTIDLHIQTLHWPTYHDLAPVTATFITELQILGIDGHHQFPGTEIAQTFFKGDVSLMHDWLQGMWLESAVLAALQRQATTLHLNDCQMNVTPLDKNNNVIMEVDVTAMRGHQLFLVSCSTGSEKKHLKLKLFEAYVRARQLGGDEARVALVSCVVDSTGLERDMQRDFDAGDSIRVFDNTNLQNLDGALQLWIRP